MIINYTDHAHLRMSQRGITKDLVIQALAFAHCYHKQGYLFYFVRYKDMPEDMVPRRRDRLKNLTIVAKPDYDSGKVIIVTVYKSDKSPHNIRRKSKRLLG